MTGLARLHNQLSDHLGQIADARRRTLAASDPEGLHDLRVAIRGLRVAISIIGKNAAKLRKAWHDAAEVTGPSRDLEVLLALIDSLPIDLQTLRASLAKQEYAAREKLLGLLTSTAFPCLVQHSRDEIDHLMRHTRMKTLQSRAKKQARRYCKIIRRKIVLVSLDSPAQDWHQLRLDVKKLRYLIEHCVECLPIGWRSLYPQLKRCQSALGELHDIDMLVELSQHPLVTERQLRLDAAWMATRQLADVL